MPGTTIIADAWGAGVTELPPPGYYGEFVHGKHGVFLVRLMGATAGRAETEKGMRDKNPGWASGRYRTVRILEIDRGAQENLAFRALHGKVEPADIDGRNRGVTTLLISSNFYVGSARGRVMVERKFKEYVRLAQRWANGETV